MGLKHKWTKFRLLMWKNYKLQFRYTIRTAVELFIPIMVILLAVITKRSTPSTTKGPIEYHSFELKTVAEHETLNNSDIFWSPCRNEKVIGLMKSILPSGERKDKCFKTAKELQIGCEANTKSAVVAIDFGDDLIGKKCIGDKISITLRLPAEISSGSWNTAELFDDSQPPEPRHWAEQYGYDPDYYETGFLTLQYGISMAIIGDLLAENESKAQLPQITMRRYPFPEWKEDKMLTYMKNALGIVIALCFIVTCVNSVLTITAEKQKKLKVLMNVVGVSNTMQWIAWFVKTQTFMLLILTVIMLMLKYLCGSNNNVFQRSNLILLFFYFALYACAATAFCFMITTFFKRAIVAAGVAAILWYLSIAPYFLIKYPDITMPIKLSCMLALNSAFSVGINLILLFEERGEGWRWNDICKPDHLGANLTMCHVNFMLLFDTLLYLMIGLYFEVIIPGVFSPSKSWRIFHRPYWFKQNEDLDIDKTPKETSTTEAMEPDPPDLKPGIKIINLKKTFRKNHNAVDNLTLNVYNDQITILLGHNGCGKTTTLNMVSGILPPTEGTVVIDDFDISKDLKHVRLRLGWCPQKAILFDELTVEEHIMFFCRLKGLSRKETTEEVEKYIGLMKLQNKKNERASALSGGMRKKLSAIIAICGKSKVCILDEPSSGMDPASRRDLWDVLQSQKNGKTILMSTHYMDEASILGDRLAIMSDGKLQALGSTFFLKNKYGAGYRLVIVKEPNCNVFELTKALRSYIPTVEVESDVGSDLVYLLPEENSPVFEGLLSNLESNRDRLGIDSFGIALTTMEDVFTKVGTSSYSKDNDIPQHVSRQPSNIHFEEKYLTGLALKKNQILAMLMKKFLCCSRSLIFLILPNFILLIIMIIIALGQYIKEDDYAPKKLVLTNNLYNDFVSMVTTTNTSNAYYKTYKEIVNEQNGTTVDWNREEFGDKMIVHFLGNSIDEKFKCLFGATFSDNAITTWFNPEGYHVAPIALQYVINTVLKTNLKCDDCNIQFVNHPLPYTARTKSKIMAADIVGLAYILGFGMVFVTAFFIFFYVKERGLKSKHLQFVSGVNISIYWGVALFWDFMCFLISIFIIAISLVCLQLDGYSTSSEIGRVVLLLLVFGVAALVQMYLMSFFFRVPALAYGQAVIINFFLGPFAVLFIHVLFMGGDQISLTGDIVYTLFLVIPHFALTAGIYEIGKKYSDIQLCHHVKMILEYANSTSTACETNNFCCDMDDDAYLSWYDGGIGKHLTVLALCAVATIILIYLIEYRMFKLLLEYCHRHQTKRVIDGDHDDMDVLEEKRKVKTGEINRREYPVVLKDLTKYHDKILAVNRICLGIQEYECFALLGTNGCGKTTTIRMIIGDLTISKGEVWIYGYNLKRHVRKSYRQVGYCPQFDALLGEMTGRETLIMFCLLRGLPYTRSVDLTATMAEKYDFQPFLNKQVKLYSGGNKRKLSTAIAVIGNPSILLLDEPTTGMDAATRRRIWNNISELREKGKCIIITTHNMEECEAVATRLAIMANGRFKCIGSPQYLKNKYSRFYILTVKMRPSDLTAQSRRDMDNVESMIRTQFPEANLQEMYSGILIYYIPIGSVTLSKIFGDMERLKRTLNVDDYTVTQSSLEQVFFCMARLQDG